MLAACAGFGTFWKAVEAAVNGFEVAKRVVWLAVLHTCLTAVVSAQSLNVNFTEFPIPTPNSIPLVITAGPDGAMWFAEEIGNKIGRITASGAITEFNLPTPSAYPEGITSGPDGALWFTETQGNKIGRITATGVITEYPLPTPFSQPGAITTGPDGALWFTEGGKVGRITTSGIITEFALSSNLSRSQAISAGPDGALWFTESGVNKIGRITTAGVITEYSVSFQIDSGLSNITAGPDGALWFGTAIGAIGRITTTGVVTQYLLPTQTNTNSAHSFTAWKDGALWFTESGGGGTGSKIGRVTTEGVITEYTHPNDSALPYSIAVGFDGSLWFTEHTSGGKIGRIQVPARTGVLSHIAAGGGWNTTIALVNTSTSSVPTRLAFYADNGSAFSLPLTVTQQGASQAITGSTLDRVIGPNTTLLIDTGNQLASTVIGWADVTSVGPVGGYAIFRQTPQTGSPSEGTVPLQSQFPSTVTLAYDNTAGFVMGVALANLSTSSASITATMWDDSGNLLGTQIITIAGSGHTAFVLPAQLALTAGKRGIVRFQSSASGGLTGLGLRFSPFGTFTSVPTM
jgi:virginiamycin B lyase